MSATAVVIILAIVVLLPFLTAGLLLRRTNAATLHTCAPHEVPPSFGASVADFVQQAFVVAGSIRITNKGLPDAYVVLFASPDRNAYGRLWVTERAPSSYSLMTPLRLGRLATSRSSPTGIDPTELQQVFPDASLPELCQRHAEALEWLAGRGVPAPAIVTGEAERLFREEWGRDVQTIRSAGPRTIVDFVVRSVLRRPRFLGPLADQPAIDERIGRLAST